MVSLVDSLEFLQEFGVFSVLVPFIFIFSVTYGMLTFVKPFGDENSTNTTLNAVIAFCVAFISLQMMPVLTFIQLIVPYLFALFMIVMLVLILFRFMGVDDTKIQNSFDHPGVYGVIIGLILLGIFIFTSASFEATSLGQTTDNKDTFFSTDISSTDSAQSTSLVTESDSGTVTIITDGGDVESEASLDSEFLQNTIFHPTLMGMFVLFLVFATAAWMIVIVKEE
jgi:hypothetical protein